MSKPTQWTTTYSTVFRDRRQYASPDSRPSDESWQTRTQGYYGPRAALGEHGARTAEVEARTNFGARDPHQGEHLHPAGRSGASQGGASFSRSAPFNGSGSYGSSSSAATASLGTLRYNHPTKDLWNAPILPHTGIYNGDSTFIPGVTATYGGISQRHATFSNGYNNGYAAELQWSNEDPSQAYQPPAKPYVPQSHIPGYQGFVRGSQFVHGETFGKTTRGLLSVPTEVPLEP